MLRANISTSDSSRASRILLAIFPAQIAHRQKGETSMDLVVVSKAIWNHKAYVWREGRHERLERVNVDIPCPELSFR
jgi:hypothetical protein